MREMKIIATRAILECKACGRIHESHKYRGSDIGNSILTHCGGECNKNNYHRVTGHILTYEDLGEVEEEEEVVPRIIPSPILIDDTVEKTTELSDAGVEDAKLAE